MAERLTTSDGRQWERHAAVGGAKDPRELSRAIALENCRNAPKLGEEG